MGEGGESLSGAASRFRADWQALDPSGRVCLAVSGGPDSLALMLLMQEVAPRDFCVATVDHGLRAESAAEAAMVAGLCEMRGIAYHTLRLDLAGGSAVQERARKARYAALADLARRDGLSAVVTAHHADDQAETLVMRLNRGAGLRGLAGMRAASSVPAAGEVRLLRPLLGWRRAELVALVEDAGLAPVLDPSNHDHRYERVRIRDVMASTKALLPSGFAASASHLAEADAALEWAVERLWLDIGMSAEGSTWNPPEGLPRALALRLLERVVMHLGGTVPRGPDLVRWLATLRAGGVATLAGVKGDARSGAWRFSRAPEHRSDRRPD